MASRIYRLYKGPSLEFEKLPNRGRITSITVGDRCFELDPPVIIEAGQRIADVISVDVLFMKSDRHS